MPVVRDDIIKAIRMWKKKVNPQEINVKYICLINQELDYIQQKTQV